MDKIYVQYAELLSEVAELEFKIGEKKTSIDEIQKELSGPSGDGSYGLTLSAHAFTNICDRLASLAAENSMIQKDLINTEDASKSILLPANLRAFVIGILSSARTKNQYKRKPSKNGSEGVEYHYESEIKKWGTSDHALIFTGIVESNTIKTGYFNWSKR